MPVTGVEQLTGFPECLDGRVKTLHPGVHAGLLADLAKDESPRAARRAWHPPFDLLVSSLYPFEQTVASGADAAECVEQIDIGGPAMIRAAAKNHATIAVITATGDYPDVIAAAAAAGSPSTSAAGWPRRRTRGPLPTTRPWLPGSPARTRRTASPPRRAGRT